MIGINKNRMSVYNRISTMKILYKEKRASKRLLAQKLNLSVPAISKILQDLEDMSYLASTGKLQKSYGRHQGYWSIAPQKDTFLCMNISPFDLKYTVVDACLSAIQPIRKESLTAENFSQLAAILKKRIASVMRSFPNITKIALSCHGIINYGTGVSMLMPRLAQKEQFPLLENLQAEINVPIKLDNSCNVYALAEKWLGEGEQIKNFVWVNLDRGIGGAIVFDDELYRGQNFTAGELGHLEIIENGPDCACGGKGCLEACVNSQILLEQWKQASPGAESLDSFFKAVQNGDTEAYQILERAAYYLKKGLAPIISLLNPQHIFIGGHLAQIGMPLLSILHNTLYTAPIYRLYYKEDISFSKLSEQDLLAGGAFLWIEDELKTPLLPF